MISALIYALIIIAILGLVVWGILSLIPLPAQVKVVIQVIAGIIALVILLNALLGNGHALSLP